MQMNAATASSATVCGATVLPLLSFSRRVAIQVKAEIQACCFAIKHAMLLVLIFSYSSQPASS